MLLFLLLLTVLIARPAPAELCSVSILRNNPEGYVWPLERVRGFVIDAEVIVHARALRLADAEELKLLAHHPGTGVVVTALEVIRGDSTSSELVLPGYFVERDDYNSGSVPYRIVRAAGQSGGCYALEYKQGAEYLLLLRTEGVSLTPYWAPLAPLNEQVQGSGDPWISWVRSMAK